MKMSEKNYEKLTAFYNYTVENANDKDVEYMLSAIRKAVASKRKELSGTPKEEINYNNSDLNKHNEKVIRDFFEDFLSKGNDDEAIYLIESLKAIIKFMVDHPEKVAEFVIKKKQAEAKKKISDC